MAHDLTGNKKGYDEKARELRAESLFRYIETKDRELRDRKTELLKLIIAKQRIKIHQSDLEWQKKRVLLAHRKTEKQSALKRKVDPFIESSGSNQFIQ